MAKIKHTIKNWNGSAWDELLPKTSIEQVEDLETRLSEVEAVARDVDIAPATQTQNGLMSKEDKVKLDGISEGATRVTGPEDIGAAPLDHSHEGERGLGAVVIVSDTAPENPKNGDIWFDTSEGTHSSDPVIPGDQ